jgi:hypothetical protein
MAIVKPILRIFDYDKAIEFYINWLGFQIDWEHRLPGTPAYIQISYRDITLHLSEHHGDGTPGSKVFIDDFENLKDYHKILIDKQYKYNRPGIETPFYDSNALEVTVTDPFCNNLILVERNVEKK